MNKFSFEPASARPLQPRYPALAWCRSHKTPIACAAAVLLGVAGLIVFRGGSGTQYLTATVEQGDISDAVEVTGPINAVRTVQVGSQVSGTIAKLYVDFNSRVRQGDLIASIDPALFQGALDQAMANLNAAGAQLEKDQASLADARSTYERDAALARQNAIAPAAVDNAKSVYDQDKAQIAVDGAAIRQNQAAVAIAKTNLAYTTIRSPVDGIVVARNVDVGQTVASSFQAPTIFTIAQDLTKMQVYANTDESDVGRIKVGRRVTFKVDAFPREMFEGVVSQIRMNATTVQNVVTYNTIIDFANPEMKLLPSMTAFVTIPVASVSHVMKVPNTALRFRPAWSADRIRAEYARAGIDSGPRESPAAAIVWKVESGDKLRPVRISTGITDHAYTQVLSVQGGDLRPGDAVATAAVEPR